MSRQVTDKAARGLLFLHAVDVTAIMVGTLFLAAALGAVGFMVSRRAGMWTLAATIVGALSLVLSVFSLVGTLR